MERIDSHQHFWNYNPQAHVWMNEHMDVLKKDYGPEDLALLLQACKLDGCIAVQASQTEEENAFLLRLANESSIIKGIVGWVDLQSANLAERLSYYKQFPLIKGFRHVIHDEPEADFMLRPTFISGVKQLKDFGYTYDILIFHSHLPYTIKFLEQLPEQAFVIDHIAKPEIRNGQLNNWIKGLKDVAAFQNVHCKISGMVTEARWKQWKKDDFKKYLDAAVEAFGVNRILYGSDWPVCTLSASYEEQYGIVADYFSGFSKYEQDGFFGLNAVRFYGLHT